ncbi:MAG TPA: hypothetical protein PKH14_13195, partial [Syntrophorhabdus sp.]|nr:hypothetical protein [Syntrophorhabdus sp.]
LCLRLTEINPGSQSSRHQPRIRLTKPDARKRLHIAGRAMRARTLLRSAKCCIVGINDKANRHRHSRPY